MPEARHEVVVITGASAGIGRAAVQQFARSGARSALIARDPDRLEAARAETELGPIDIWVNNAMATVFAPFADIAPEDFRRVTDVTCHGFVWGTMAALKRVLGNPSARNSSTSTATSTWPSSTCRACTRRVGWCKTTLTHHPKPIGTYYQPEVAARAIFLAAHARRAWHRACASCANTEH